MMINKRLINAVPKSKQYIAANVAFQWISLVANITLMASIANMLSRLYENALTQDAFLATACIAVVAIAIRCLCTVVSSKMGYLSGKEVKKTLRSSIYSKLLRLGTAYRTQVNTSEVVQVAVEGVDQLETYFGAYLPQFFYAMLAPLTLFVTLSFVSFPCAIILLVCVPLIPVTIVAVQRWAKRLLSKYWGQYTALGDTFLENLQGLTTTKIYQSDAFQHQQMNEESERFRKITMKVLTMQLNSITIMDLIAYGGAALGVILATSELRAGHVELAGCILIILLAADFFLPMRLLGSYFHIAMNGMAATDKIFRLLDLPEPPAKTLCIGRDHSITCRDVHFSYDPSREILHGIDMEFPMGSFTAIVGASGCGKSTVASLLMGANAIDSGDIHIGGVPLSEISEESLMRSLTYISHRSILFRGTVRENLLMARTNAGDDTLWQVLEQVNLGDFLRSEQGLDTPLAENASNLSGGQRQRLALARALLHDSPIYIFDEATSNIDVESENDIMREVYALAKSKTVILISHRLANVTGADNIYVMQDGRITEHGDHATLLARGNTYADLWNAQQSLEHYTKGGVQA